MNFVNKNSQINKMYLCKHLKKKHSPKQFEFRWQKEKQNKTTTISINRLIANSLEKLTVISIVNHYSAIYLFARLFSENYLFFSSAKGCIWH